MSDEPRPMSPPDLAFEAKTEHPAPVPVPDDELVITEHADGIITVHRESGGPVDPAHAAAAIAAYAPGGRKDGGDHLQRDVNEALTGFTR